MITVADARAAARKRFDRELRGWAVDGGDDAVFSLGLKPPTEQQARSGANAVRPWIDSWTAIGGCVWEERRWPTIGAQRVPARLELHGADRIAAFIGPATTRTLATTRERAIRVLDRLGRTTETVSAVRTQARVLANLPEPDIERLLGVVEWLRANPASGWRIRQLPIRGVDTKWVGTHRGLVESLVTAVTGSPTLGLTEAVPLVRMRILDPSMRPAGITDVTAPIADVAAMPIHPHTVLIVENLETLLALPDLDGVVAVFGGGFGAHERVGDIPWIVESRVLYWGDLDSHGFAILNQLRTRVPAAKSILMDEQTLLAHRDLWVEEATPAPGTFPLLVASEQRALARLRMERNARLEQERLAWGYVLSRLTRIPVDDIRIPHSEG